MTNFLSNPILWVVALLAIAALVFFGNEITRGGKYRVRMANAIAETDIVKGQYRIARYTSFKGWEIRITVRDERNRKTYQWVPCNHDDLKSFTPVEEQ